MLVPTNSANLAFLAFAVWLTACLCGFARASWSARTAAILFGLGSAIALGSAFANSSVASMPAWVGIAGQRCDLFADSLSRWFVGLIGMVGLIISIYTPGYLSAYKGKARPGLVWSGLAALFISMSGVVLARNAVLFFVFWETMALSSFLLVATEHEKLSVRRAAAIYLGATRLGSGFLMAGFIWAYAISGSWDFASWTIHSSQATGPAAMIAIGLLVKAGSWPFHIWLPIAHPVAPSPVSAVMSGVMIKTAIYAIFRFFVFGGIDAPWLGWVLVGLGAVSAFWGVLFALLQHNLKRLLAYSSVENIGLILLAIGLALVARGAHLDSVASLAIGAALFHTLNHGMFKSLLFLCAGTVDSRTHTKELDQLGGLIKKMPWTAAGFAIGSASICALPPLNGFASEWLLYRGFFGFASNANSGETRLLGLLLMGWLALVGALALACFVKAFGIAFLASPRSSQAEKATEGSLGMSIAVISLAAACLVLGLGSGAVWTVLGQLGLVQGELQGAVPIVPLMAGALAIIGLLYVWVRSLRNRRQSRSYVTWDCGFGPLSARSQYTAASFAQPITRLFGVLYKYDIEIDVERKHHKNFASKVSISSSHEPYLESRFYTPILKSAVHFSERLLMRLQAGSIHQYLLFMVIVLGIMLWIGGGK